MDWERLGRLGIYDPAAPHADTRRALLEFLDELGVAEDDMVEADRVGELAAAASDLAVRGLRTLTKAEVAELVGLSDEEFDRAVLSTGFAAPPSDAVVFSEADVGLYGAFKYSVDLFGIDATLQFTRVIGSSLGRIAEAAAAMFLAEIERDLVADDRAANELQLAKVNYEATQLLLTLPTMFDSLFRRHIEAAVRRTRGTRLDPGTFDEFRLTICFLDLVGYTTMARGLTASELARAVNDFEAPAIDMMHDRGARLVKSIGDEVMFVAADAAVVCDIALDLCTLVDEHEVLTGLRGGIARGPLLARDGDYFGPVVNLAARATKLAVPGSVLATGDVRQAANASFRFVPIGPTDLKGIDEPVELFSVSRP